MSSTCNSMHITQQVEDLTSSRRASTLLNLVKTEKNIIQKIDIMITSQEFCFWCLLMSSMSVWMYVQGKDGKEFSLSILANLSDHYSLTDVLDIHSETHFSMNNRDQWAELGIAKKSISTTNSVFKVWMLTGHQ